MALVSIWITTYNHEQYIAQAIESVLMQQTTFDYELVIGEDCSSDRTREIVKAYQKKFPDKIKLFLPEQNLGMIPMFKATYNLCTGRYVAWLDGDDYWTDPLKLQKQVDFMEANPEFVLCFHRVNILNQIRKTRSISVDPAQMGPNGTLGVEHFLQIHNPIDTPSVLHRNVLGQHLPDWYYALPFPDFGFYFLLLQYGKAKFLNENMCVYRIHKGGAWSGQQAYKNNADTIQFYAHLSANLPYLPKQRISWLTSYYRCQLLLLDLKERNFKSAKSNLKLILDEYPGVLINQRKKLFSALMRATFKAPILLIKKVKASF